MTTEVSSGPAASALPLTRSQGHDDRLDEVILEYIDMVEAGESLDRDEFINRHPEFRAELESFFDSRDRVERVAAPLREAAADEQRLRSEVDKLSATRSHVLGNLCDRTGNTSDRSGNNADRLEAYPTISSDAALGQLGEFRLLTEIGRGGMGIVYEAEQQSLQRRVALKVLPFAAAIDAKHVLRFKNEALAAGMLNHPHIVPVYSVGNERGVHFYAMQLIDGQSLGALIAELRVRSRGGASSERQGASRRSEPSEEPAASALRLTQPN